MQTRRQARMDGQEVANKLFFFFKWEGCFGKAVSYLENINGIKQWGTNSKGFALADIQTTICLIIFKNYKNVFN